MYAPNYMTAVLSGNLSHARVAGNTSTTNILSASTGRVHASVFNHSNASLYLKFEGVATINDFDVKLSSGSYFELPKPIYQGVVNGVWDSANGFAMILDMVMNNNY